MGKPNRSTVRKVINGRMTVTTPRRDCIEVLVYAGPEEEGEPVGDWGMPKTMRYDLDLAAKTAERQTPRDGDA